MDPDSMVSGAKYRVRYQIPGLHRIPREMVAKFISIDKDGIFGDAGRDKFVFSGRPEFGTTDLERRHLLGAEMVPSSTECFHSRKVSA
jgi:hypothetical protein